MNLVKRLLRQLLVVKYRFLFGVALLLLATIGVQYAPLLIQQLIDTVLTPVTQGQSLQVAQMWSLSALFVSITIIANAIGYCSSLILMDCANHIGEYLRNQAYDKMQTLPISYFDDKPAGKISSRIVNNTDTLRIQFYGSLLTQFLYNSAMIVVIYIIIFSLNIWLGMILLLLLPVFYYWQVFYQRMLEKPMADYYEAQGDVNTHVNEAMNGSVIIQLFHQEKNVTQRFEETSQKLLHAFQKEISVEAAFSWNLVELFKRLTIAILLAFVGYQFLGGTLGMTLGAVFAYVNYIERLFNAMGQMVRSFPGIQRSLATGRRVFELLDEPSEKDTTDLLQVSDGVVVFDRVVFGYNSEQPVLKNISFKADKGQTVALVGHTGSGKTSIMNLLFRFYDPQQGQILIDGQNIQLYNRESVRQDMGIVLQDPYLFTGTIKSNVAMDDETMSDDVVIDALRKVGAQDLLKRLDNGIYEPVFEKGNTYSSGERQLISFARTLAANPKILILDEATSHIDTETEEIIQHAMNVVKEGRTTFIIAHRLSTIQNADQILVLHEGEIVERGTHQELMLLNGKYADMYKTQQRVA